ncbi:MAG: chorismate mutase [Chitinophagales bacterium]
MKNKLIIAGPCSAETEEQVMETLEKIATLGKVNMLRAGIWKPRTRPGSFEGVGAIGLKWLINAGKKVNLPVITEVANKDHVALALNAGFKNLWIGARTTVNPFAIQEIADNLQGRDIDLLLIKNPINPDLQLWIGAIERCKKAGVKNIGVIHRGFSAFKTNKYRNEPLWEIPLMLKEKFPDIQLICDPSHICGRRDTLEEVSQKAMDLEYDGLMIETHREPDVAWSDAKQQITPKRLGEMLDHIIMRQKISTNPESSAKIEVFREQLESMDHQILEILSKRMAVAQKIGEIKKENNITILQSERWKLVKDERLKYGLNIGLTEKFLTRYLNALHQESIRHQTKVMN